MARLMMLCSLPRTNPGRQLQYKRVNGPYTLIMTAVGQTGLPFGNLSRLLLAWVCTEAVRTQSRELFLGPSLSGFMRQLDMAPIGGGSRGERTRLRDQMRRLFGCSVTLIYEDTHSSRFVSSHIAESGEFWWNPAKPDQPVLWDSKIRLSEPFFNEIINHPVPIDMNTLKALKRCALGLDLYLWITYRTFSLRAPLRLSWRQLYQQFGTGPGQGQRQANCQNLPSASPARVEEDQNGLAGSELRDGSGSAGPLALQTRHRSHVPTGPRSPRTAPGGVPDCALVYEYPRWGRFWGF